MDKKLIYGALIILFIAILLGALYIFHKRIKSLESTKLQLQKHILYHQQVIERYNQYMRSSNPEESIPNIPLESLHPQVVEPPVQQERPSPSSPLQGGMGSILPMMSSLMSMMQPPNDSPPVATQQEEQEDTKKDLEDELADELKELQESIPSEKTEGRVDEVSKPPGNLKEVTIASDVKSISSEDSVSGDTIASNN